MAINYWLVLYKERDQPNWQPEMTWFTTIEDATAFVDHMDPIYSWVITTIPSDHPLLKHIKLSRN